MKNRSTSVSRDATAIIQTIDANQKALKAVDEVVQEEEFTDDEETESNE